MHVPNLNSLSVFGDMDNTGGGTRRKRSVYLEGAQTYYQPHKIKVGPAPNGPPLPFNKKDNGVVFECLTPINMLGCAMGIFPIRGSSYGMAQVSLPMIIYSIFLLLVMSGYIGYIKWDHVEMVKSTEGKFEEAVIDYLFTVYLVPIIILPLTWYESRNIASIYCEWSTFERIYLKISGKRLALFMGNKPLLVTLGLPILSCAIMVVTHITMAHFRFLQVVPYCYINTITYLVGGMWYLQCNVIGRIATLIADDFQQALHHVGPSVRVAEYRSLWMMLSKLTRNLGDSVCYMVTFLCLYLFLVITLTVYGLLSQIQGGLGIKDVGLTVSAVFATGLLYFVCDEAHYASNCVRVYFQKKLLLVELSWMNDDAQQEINMFLRATEMNQTDISLGGFFDVNRNLFKSLLATMVTYLVVLLQFQISIPEDTGDYNITDVLT
ncbi:gustatory and odorant receptor 24 [Onthophagus taurus]|uniref:gustatory and odorant receptor 24 n=1 Tax=Onthophagus taurus TaxID=166361 RepID=UPI000C20534C|nr:gustatory and odorant receptor 24 [Onthophagus taurus]